MSINLSISPQQIEYIIKPGASIIQSYKIRNESNNPIYLTSSVESWQPLGDDGLLTYHNAPTSSDISFSLNNSDLQLGNVFSIAPNSETQLVLKIKASPEAKESDHYTTFFLTQNESIDNQNQNSQSQTSVKIGSHILLSVSNTENTKEEFQIIEFNSTPKFKDILFNNINFSAKIDNQSSHFYKINGQLLIEKNNLQLNKIDLSQSNVLSHSNRRIYCSYQNQEEIANCQIKPPFWPGKYSATLLLSSNTASKSATINFFVFPYFLCLTILSVLVIIITIFSLKKATS